MIRFFSTFNLFSFRPLFSIKTSHHKFNSNSFLPAKLFALIQNIYSTKTQTFPNSNFIVVNHCLLFRHIPTFLSHGKRTALNHLLSVFEITITNNHARQSRRSIARRASQNQMVTTLQRTSNFESYSNLIFPATLFSSSIMQLTNSSYFHSRRMQVFVI